jgi:hypothetical protein
VVNPTVLDRLRNEDEKHLIEMEKRYFGKLSFRADTGMHAEQFKIVNVENNEELPASAHKNRWWGEATDEPAREDARPTKESKRPAGNR